MTKDDDLKRLEEIALLTDRDSGIFAERRSIWKRRLEAKDCTQAELARYSHVGRADIVRGILRG
jgi:hypothetical protein